MKKTLIALTLAALPVAASADVILYGQVKGGIEVDFYKKQGSQKNKGTTTQIVDYGSRIGFKGHEHLNGDLKAIWQVEQSVDIAGGATNEKYGIKGFGTRNSFIGLQSDTIGTVKAGYFSTPVDDAVGRLDDWEYSNGLLGLGKYTAGTDVSKRAVAVSYTTPNMAGFSATAYVSPSDNNSGKTPGRDSAIYGLGATYENNGFFADVAGGYAKNGVSNGTIDAANPNIKEKEGYQIVANVGYENEQVLAGIGYNRTKNVNTTSLAEDNLRADVGNQVAATVAYKVSPNLRLKGSAAHGFKISARGGAPYAGDGKYYQGIVGADYALSKRTTVNGQVGFYQEGKGDDKTQRSLAGVGLKHKF